MRFRSTPLLAVLAAAAFAAGCGGSSDSGSPSTPAAADAPSPGGAATISTDSTSDLGTFLVDAQGRTLYLWEADKGTDSTCSGACAAAWPPVVTDGAPKAAGDASAADLGTTTRADGTSQVTYAGHPLYLFAGDAAPGDTNGQGDPGFGAPWYVVAPDGASIDKS